MLEVERGELRAVKAAVESAITAIAITDADAVITYVNPAFVELWGLDGAEEAIGRLPTDFAGEPDEPIAVMEVLRSSGYFRGEVRGRRKDGVIMDLEVAASSFMGEDGKLAGLLATFVDVTERNRALADVRRTSDRLRVLETAVDAAVTAIATAGLDGIQTYANPAFLELWGLERQEDAMRHVASFVEDPADAAAIVAELQRKGRWKGDLRARHEDGRVMELEVGAALFTDEAGNPAGTIGTFLDVTERKRALDALARSEATLLRTQEIAHVGGWEWTPVEDDTTWSPETYRIFGVDAESFAPTFEGWIGLVHPEDRARVLEIAGRARKEESSEEFEYRIVRPDGEVRTLHEFSDVLRDETGRILSFLGTVQDVTDERQAQEERRTLLARFVEALEVERADIAAEVHDGPVQLMTAASMRLHALRRGLSDPSQAEAVERMEREIEELIGDWRRLMSELRPPALDRHGFTAALEAYLAGAAKTAGFEYEIDDMLVEEPPLPTRTVLFRIAQHAVLNVQRHARATHVRVRIQPSEDGVLVHIADDGVGFDPTAPEVVPSPTRLGLAVMRERAELAGGWWTIQSAPGRGTKVEFWVPA